MQLHLEMQVNSALAERAKSFMILSFIHLLHFLSWFYSHSFICLLAGGCCEFEIHHGTASLSVYKCRMTLVEVIFLPPCSVIAAGLFETQTRKKKVTRSFFFL